MGGFGLGRQRGLRDPVPASTRRQACEDVDRLTYRSTIVQRRHLLQLHGQACDAEHLDFRIVQSMSTCWLLTRDGKVSQVQMLFSIGITDDPTVQPVAVCSSNL